MSNFLKLLHVLPRKLKKRVCGRKYIHVRQFVKKKNVNWRICKFVEINCTEWIEDWIYFEANKFSNRVNVRAPIQFGRESQLHHLTKWLFLKNRPIHFYINRTSVIKLIKWNKLSPSSIEIKALQSSPFDACDRSCTRQHTRH